MKIAHVIANAPYNDYWGYQDNLLPKYHKKMGHDVVVITTTLTHKKDGVGQVSPCDYTLRDGQRIIRKEYKNYHNSTINSLFTKLNIVDILKKEKPDFIFYHGLVSNTIFDVIKYKRQYNKKCIIVEDNHLDYNIGSQSTGLKKILGRGYYRLINKLSIPYVERVYGVTPWRKQYAEEYFRIPSQKTDVLIMGADDEKILFNQKHVIRNCIRKQYGIEESDFLVVTGGKLDKKKNINVLIDACGKLSGVKLLVFGTLQQDVKNKCQEQFDKYKNIIYIGWIDADNVYDYFFAADLVFFPGQHSVLWEQACACKVPCVFKYWEGMDHVNNGGNSLLLHNIDESAIINTINSLKFTQKYYCMKKDAESNKTDIYLYSQIAIKSLECCKHSNNN